MDIYQLLLLFTFLTILILFLVFYFYFTLFNPQIRTLLFASIPFLNKGRVVIGNFHSSRKFNLELVKVNENILEKYPKEAGLEKYKLNREIDPGTHYTEPGSNRPIYFVTAGLAKTFDPIVSRSPSKVDNIIISQSMETGKEIQKFLYNLENPKETKGPKLIMVAVAAILVGLFVAGMLWQVNVNQIELNSAVSALASQVSAMSAVGG